MVDSGVRGGFVSWSRRGVMLLGVGVLTGCVALGDVGEDRSQLPVLLEDPLAAEDLLGLPEKTRPTRSHETKHHRHDPFGCSCVASAPGRCREGRCFLITWILRG